MSHDFPSLRKVLLTLNLGLSWRLRGKEFTCSAGDAGSIPELGRSAGGGNGKPLQYFCLENLMDIGAWWATVCGITEADTT